MNKNNKRDKSQFYKEHIAIIGMGCRFPGADNPDEFWELLRKGKDAIVDIPASRWDVEAYYDAKPKTPGKMYVRKGGFLKDVSGFDHAFFQLSLNEATSLDPQQRLLLEISWEAIENAGLTPEKLEENQTGVFVGLHWDDYSAQRIYQTDPTNINRYSILSNQRGLAAGRISHVLGINGPSMLVDTACSSSLVTIHLACQSLRTFECDTALAGGASLILGPEQMIGLSQMEALAQDGRCKTFDEKADGFGHGEGCGILVLKRLVDAIDAKDNILGVIRSSVVNHDGRSRTMTTPNGLAQRAMLHEAVMRAGIQPNQIQYVETHGTGTIQGDPIEVLALAKVLGQQRDKPLKIGSVKTNLGHLDAAAGIASLIKVLLAIQHNEIPPHLNCPNPNPRIPWQDLNIQIVSKMSNWTEERKLAGVSSFGLSGTNAHLIVESWPQKDEMQHKDCHWHILTLSAKSKKALIDLAGRYKRYLALSAKDISDICFTANTGRVHFPHRLAVIASAKHELVKRLDDFIAAKPSNLFETGQAVNQKSTGIGFIFAGQDASIIGMGKVLYKTESVFRIAFDQCAKALDPYLEKSLVDIFNDNAEVIEPALFAIEYALSQLWLSWGVKPDFVMGVGIGEYVAACVAGLFELDEGVKLAASYQQHKETAPIAEKINFTPPKTPLICPVTGNRINEENWLKRPLRATSLTCGINKLAEMGVKFLVEIGSDSYFQSSAKTSIYWLSSQLSHENHSLLNSLAKLYAHGVKINWDSFYSDHPYQKVSLPTYPFQRTKHWLDIVPSTNANTFKPKETVHDYYNSISQHLIAPDSRDEEIFLTFGPLADIVPGFSWLLATVAPDQYPDYYQISQKAVVEMREILFSQIDFSPNKYRKVLDFGCGYGSDLINLAHKYPYLELCGYTISSDQALKGTQSVGKKGLEKQIQLFNRDSSKDEFPENYDLIFGFEVVHHVKDKGGLFRNIGKHLNHQGSLLIADFISNVDFTIAHEKTESYFIFQEEWNQLLSQNGLMLNKGIDISHEVANYLYEANFEEHLKQLGITDENVLASFTSYDQLGRLLHKKLASYVLLSAQKREDLSVTRLMEHNKAILSALNCYDEMTTSRWIYQLQWKPDLKESSNPPATSLRVAKKRWLIFADTHGLAESLVDVLNSWGDECIFVAPGNGFEQKSNRDFRIKLTAKQDFERLLSAIPEPDGILHLWHFSLASFEAASLMGAQKILSQAQEEGCGSVLYLLQTLNQKKWSPHLWLVTQGATKVDIAQVTDFLQPQQSMIWGLGKVIKLEHPELNCVCLDLDPSANTEMAIDAFVRELYKTDLEDEIAYRKGVRHVARLVRTSHLETPDPIKLHEEGCYMITGGLGGLGLMIAEFLVQQGARHLVLLGRSGASSVFQQQAIQNLQQMGTSVKVIKADVSKAEDVKKMLEATGPQPVKGIVHAAGVLDDGVLNKQTIDRFMAVMEPKVKGVINLHYLTQDLPLDFFICFSSIASLMGSSGQGNYAAANAFMDALIHFRQQKGLAGLTINWGGWAEAGMSAKLSDRLKSQSNARGLGVMTSEKGLQIFKQLLAQDSGQYGVFLMDWSKFQQQEVPFFSELIFKKENISQKSYLIAKLTKLSPDASHSELIIFLQNEVSKILGLDVSQPPEIEIGFFEMGIDSLSELELRNVIQKNLQLSLSSTVLFEHPNIQALSDYLIAQVKSAESPNEEIALDPQISKPDNSAEPEEESSIETKINDELAKLKKMLEE